MLSEGANASGTASNCSDPQAGGIMIGDIARARDINMRREGGGGGGGAQFGCSQFWLIKQ